MRRITKVAIISTVAGSTLFVGAQFAFPASADDGDWADWCASRPGIPPSFSPTSTPTLPPSGDPTSPPSGDPTSPPGDDDPTSPPSGDPTLSPMADGRALHLGADSSASASRTPGPRPSGNARRHHWRRHWWGWHRPSCPSTPPSGSPTASPTASPTGSPTASPTGSVTPSSTPPSSKPPTSSSSKPPTSPSTSCTTAAGAASNVASPGVGAVTVTIKVCNGQLTTSTGSLSQSNWNDNTAAMKQLDTLAVQYHKTDVTKIHYSGATLTSNAYQASLKSALTKAGL